MAIDPSTNATMSGRITAADANYPFGSSQDETAPAAADGTPYFKARADDIFGFQQAILERAGITPSGNADTALVSQYLDGLVTLLKSGRRNLLRGLFRVNQRGVTTPVSLSAGEYGHDGFRGGSSGGDYSFATVSGLTTVTITSDTLEQEVKGSDTVAGDYVLSWGGNAQGRINGGAFGDSGEPTITIGGSTTLTVEFNAGTLFLPQLELGYTPTPPEWRSFKDEFSLCQEWLFTLNETGVMVSAELTGGTWVGAYSMPTTMRVTPSIDPLTTTIHHNRLGTGDPDVVISLDSSSGPDAVGFNFTDGTASGPTGALEVTAGQRIVLSAEP